MVEVRKKPRETTPALIRRFSTKVRMSGLLIEAKKRRFHVPPLSEKEKKEKVIRKALKKKNLI